MAIQSRNIVWLPQLAAIAITMLLACAPALAQTTTSAIGDGFFVDFGKNIVDAVKYVINTAIGSGFANTVKGAALGMSAGTTGAALSLAAGLAIASLFWKVLLDLLQQKSVIGSVMEVFIYASVAAVLIANYSQVIDTVWGVGQSLLTSIAPGGPADALLQYATSIFSAVGRAFSSLTSAWNDATVATKLAMIGDIIGTILILVGIFFMMMMSISEIIGVFVMGPVFFAVGVVFGPMMIATMVSDFTRGWFGQWLNFLVSSAMLTTVAVVVLILLVQVIGSAVSNVGQPGSSGLLSLMGIGILTMSLSKLFSSVPTITDAIFPGRTGAGHAIQSGGGAKAMAAAAVGLGGLTKAISAAKATPGAVAGVASKSAGAIVGALNAKSHLTSGLNSVGKAMSDTASATKQGASKFAYDVKHSDAGKYVGDLADKASTHARNTVGVPEGDMSTPSWHKFANPPESPKT